MIEITMPKKKPLTAAQMGKRRWKGVSKQKKSRDMRALALKMWQNLTPEERSARAKRNWKTRRKRARLAEQERPAQAKAG